MKRIIWGGLAALSLAGLLGLAACGEAETSISAQAQSDSAAQTSATAPANEVPVIQASAPVPEAIQRTGELISPDDEAIAALYYGWANEQPPIEDLAKAKIEYDSSVNEFNRAEKLAAAAADYQRQFEAGADAGFIRLNLRSSLSEYDAQYGEFYLSAFTPGNAISYKAFGRKYRLQFENDMAAYRWQVPVEDAQKIAARAEERNPYRNLTIPVRLQVTGVSPAGNGGTIRAKILSYTIQNSTSDKVLGQVKLED